VALRAALEGCAMPSKLYGILAAGRPIAHLGDPAGEIARLLAESGAGQAFGPGQGERLAEWIRSLSRDPLAHANHCTRARTLFETRYTRSAALDRWRQVLAAAAPVTIATREAGQAP
jgi:hypothetical protein